ncbi:helix-turn-helix domain-containing protein [Ruegeria sp. 2205SS24-7]|uniref:ArsR/SmtB family transcription factor n=1 Tax=Ruegeria discodermiae TaxID=3064389 RepID=UPI002741A445|nr:helix-turn-helix domain-containing protein [Ruegeria sp. 2205SS24-7]MDP5218830.1 helix-turn-helix domain-containing protein [Ruegeria sp. 2205SS24-7]
MFAVYFDDMINKRQPKPALKHDIAEIVPDTTALKALAHPERLRMLGLLRVEGPATSTSLAKRLGLNSGATSYHLRKLAEHGFIETAPELGNNRERWWRSKHDMTVFDASEKSGDALEAGLAMSQAVISQHMEHIQRALGQYRSLPTSWRKMSTANDIVIPVTEDEAREVSKALMTTLRDANARYPRQDAPLPSGTRNFMIVLHTFPFPELSSLAIDDNEQ